MDSLEAVKNKWSFCINNNIGDKKVPENIIIDASHPYVFEKSILHCNTIDDLIILLYKDDNKHDFYSFQSTSGIIIYFKQDFKKLLESHPLYYYKFGFFYSDLHDLYTNEFVATVETDELAYVSLFSTIYGSEPINNSIVAHPSIPFDFYFLDCFESFKLLQFDKLKRDKKPINCIRIYYPDYRLLYSSNSIYMLYVNQSLETIAYYGMCAIIHGLRTGQFDIKTFNGKLFVDAGDRGVVIEFNSSLKKYIKLFTKLILRVKDKNCSAEDIVRDFYKSNDKILYWRQ